MTTADVVAKYNEFFSANNGKSVEVEDANNLWQCMDLAFAWVDKLAIPRETIRHLYAYQVWKQPLDVTLQYFWYIPNTANGVPKMGDLVVFDAWATGIAGHIELGTGVGSSMSYQGFSQNWGCQRYARLVTHSYDGVLGWLRPITNAPTVNTQPLVDQITDLTNRIAKAKVDLG